MSKRLIVILALAFVVGISFAAYAEVQNVKVSGDITVKGVARDNLDLVKTQTKQITTDISGTPVVTNFDDKSADILSIARVRVDADLTDNVSATVRLLNERNWNGESNFAANTNLGQSNRNIGLNSNNTADNENDIDLDLAYITLKEFLYSPLSLMVGRQELHFGNDLVVGDPDTNIYSAATDLAEGDLSARKSFDAIRATLDYNPLVLDVIYAKVEEAAANLNDDVTLSGINASYELNKNTSLEAFMFNKVKGSMATQVYNVDAGNATSFAGLAPESDIVNTIGVRAVDKSVNNLSLDGTLAYQFGRYNPQFDANARFDTSGSVDEGAVVGGRMHKRSAWAAQLKAAYDLKDVAMLSKYSPVVSAGYTYLSGADRFQKPNKAYEGWDPMFENQTEGHLINAILANTNMHRANLGAKVKLTDDVGINLDYVAAWFAKRYPENAINGSRAILSGVYGTTLANSGDIFRVGGDRYIGSEIDATLTYDYTEDVQLSLLGGILIADDNIRADANDFEGGKNRRANATELIGSMKVTF